MRGDDDFYQYVLHQCQSLERERRLEALEDLHGYGYLDRVGAQFLLDRFNSTADEHEQSVILGLMGQLTDALPIGDALLAIFEGTSSLFLCMDVALDPEEHPWLREAVIEHLTCWEERVSDELLYTLLADPHPVVCLTTLEVWRERPAHTIPLETVLSYCTHEKESLREAALKTLLATRQQAAMGPILVALKDPETRVRTAASFACISLAEWFPNDLPLDPLLQALQDEYPPVRENILDACGKIPLCSSMRPITCGVPRLRRWR